VCPQAGKSARPGAVRPVAETRTVLFTSCEYRQISSFQLSAGWRYTTLPREISDKSQSFPMTSSGFVPTLLAQSGRDCKRNAPAWKEPPVSQDTEGPGPLSIHCAFLVHFGCTARWRRGGWQGVLSMWSQGRPRISSPWRNCWPSSRGFWRPCAPRHAEDRKAAGEAGGLNRAKGGDVPCLCESLSTGGKKGSAAEELCTQ